MNRECRGAVQAGEPMTAKGEVVSATGPSHLWQRRNFIFAEILPRRRRNYTARGLSHQRVRQFFRYDYSLPYVHGLGLPPIGQTHYP